MSKKPINKKLIIRIAVIAAAVMIVAAAVFAFLAFHNRISDEKAREILSELIPEAEEINDIVWGEGLPVVEGAQPISSVSGAQYREVAENAAYHSIDELKAAIKKVYSDQYFEETINYVAFTDIEPLTTDQNGNPDTSTALYARYIENGNGVFCADIIHPAFDTSARTCDAATAHVVKTWFDRVFVEIDVTDRSTGETFRQTIRLKKQSDGWRLDDPTY